MRKIIILALALIMVLSFVACGDTAVDDKNDKSDSSKNEKNEESGNKDSDNSDEGNNGDLDDIDWDEFDDAVSQLNDYLKSLGLSEDEYGFTQYGVWNSDLLPDCVPSEPTGGVLEIDRTEYKDKNHEELLDMFDVGNIYFPDKNYERHMVMFTCTQAQLDEFVAGMTANGFEYGKPYEEWGRTSYEWLGNGYYAFLRASESYDDEDKIFATFNITPTLGNPHPKSFNGIALPDFGLVMSYNEVCGYGFNEDDGNWEDVYDFWNVYQDKGDLPDDWYVSYDYDFVKIDEAKTYVQKLIGSGWILVYDGEKYYDYYEKDKYYAQLEKDGIIAAIDTSYEGENVMSVRFGTYAEMLYY